MRASAVCRSTILQSVRPCYRHLKIAIPCINPNTSFRSLYVKTRPLLPLQGSIAHGSLHHCHQSIEAFKLKFSTTSKREVFIQTQETPNVDVCKHASLMRVVTDFYRHSSSSRIIPFCQKIFRRLF